MLKNTPDRYGLIAQLFHWTLAVLMISLLGMGMYMSDLPSTDPNKFPLYGLHKSFGITVLILFVGRLFWRLYNAGLPQSNPKHAKWERRLAHAVHVLLYVTAIAMPLSGWGMSSAGGHPVSLFGLALPPLVPKDPALGAFFSGAHSVIGWMIIGLVALHVIGALKHYFIDKDGTISRMLFCPCKKRNVA